MTDDPSSPSKKLVRETRTKNSVRMSCILAQVFSRARNLFRVGHSSIPSKFLVWVSRTSFLDRELGSSVMGLRANWASLICHTQVRIFLKMHTKRETVKMHRIQFTPEQSSVVCFTNCRVSLLFLLTGRRKLAAVHFHYLCKVMLVWVTSPIPECMYSIRTGGDSSLVAVSITPHCATWVSV